MLLRSADFRQTSQPCRLPTNFAANRFCGIVSIGNFSGKTIQSVGPAVRLIWRAEALGLKPLRTNEAPPLRNASAQNLLPAAMFERWPHICRVKITFGGLPTNWFVSTRTNLMKYLVNWISLRIRVRSRNTQPFLSEMNL